MRKLTLGMVGALVFTATSAFALDKDDEDALKNTQQLMSDQQAMNAFAKDNKDAAHALDQVNDLTHGNQQQQAEINNVSSSIFTDMVSKNGGDTVAIQAQLQEALKNPSGFINGLTPEQQSRIRNLASQIDKQNAASVAPAAAPASAAVAAPAATAPPATAIGFSNTK